MTLPLDVPPTQGGGIVIYLRSTLRFSRIALDMEITSFEALCLSIATPRGSLTVLTVYRPGSVTPPDIFFTEFASVLESLCHLSHLLEGQQFTSRPFGILPPVSFFLKLTN